MMLNFDAYKIPQTMPGEVQPTILLSQAIAEPVVRVHQGYSAEFDTYDANGWERLVSSFDDAGYEQTRSMAGNLWGESRLSHMVLNWNSTVVAAVQTVVLIPPLLDSGIAYVKFGPLWRRKGVPEDPAHLEAALGALIDHYVNDRGLMLTLLPPPDPRYTDIWERALSKLQFAQRRGMADPNRYLLNLTLSEVEQRQSLQQKWRYNLKKSEKNSFTMKSYRGMEGFEVFAPLYREMLSRKKFADTSGFETVVPGLCRNLPDAIEPETIICEHDGRPTAGAVIGRIGDTAHYLFGATDHRALPLKAGFAMQWWVVNHLSKAGAHWYDLGGEANDPGLRQFKKGLVGRDGAIVHMPGEYDVWGSTFSQITGDAIFATRAVRAAVRSWKYK